MIEPHRREDSDFVTAVKAEAALIARLRARVAELEKERDELAHELEGALFLLRDESELRDKDRERAARAEAGFAAAQEALKEAMAHARDRKLECRRDAGQGAGSGYEFIGMANGFAEMAEFLHSTLADALARGGGQQENR